MAIKRTPTSLSMPTMTPEAAQNHSLYGRRDFLTRAGLACLSGVILGGIGLIVRPLWPKGHASSSLLIPAGRPEDYRIGEINQKLLAKHGLWIRRTPDGFMAMSARCTHLGCKLRYLPGAAQFHCMCHGSLFAENGEVLRGPAIRPMERVFISLSSDEMLMVNPELYYRQERGEWAQPGAFAPYHSSYLPSRNRP